jgi:hypothetical protein
MWLKSAVVPVSPLGGEMLVWGQKIVWGYDIVSSLMLYFNDPAWSTHVEWGTGSLMTQVPETASNIVWGSNIPWDEKIVWGNQSIGTVVDEKIVWGYVDSASTIAWADLTPDDYSDGAKIVWSFITEGEH